MPRTSNGCERYRREILLLLLLSWQLENGKKNAKINNSALDSVEKEMSILGV